MNFSKRKNVWKASCASIIALLIFVLLCGIGFIEIKDTASAYVTLPTGTINNLYNSTTQSFVKENLNAVARTANYSDIDAMIKGVVNNNDEIDATGFATDTTIKFGTYCNISTGDLIDLVWIPVYLSKDKTGKKAILTLWLANIDATDETSNQEHSTWTDGTYNTSYTVQQNGMICNSYDGSYIRNVTLNNGSSYLGNWGKGTAIAAPNYTYPTEDKSKNKFVDFTTGKLSAFIATPSQVPWQMAQDLSANDPSWSGHITSPADTEKIVGFYPNSWINDKVWLPSLSDIFSLPGFGRVCLWNCSDSQLRLARKANTYYYGESWLRSGMQTQSDVSLVETIDFTKTTSITRSNDLANLEACVRPAIHLDLSAAALAGAIDVPQDVSVEYTGLPLDFTAVKTKPTWYLSDKMDVAFADGSAGKTDCGEYEMTATINTIAAAQGLKFKGTPDINNGETDISRKFKFKITQKKIGGTISLIENKPKFSVNIGAIHSGDTIDNGRAPEFVFEYKNKVSGQVYDEYPEGKVGTYTATVKIINTDCFYKLDKAYSTEIKIDRTKVAKPSIAVREKVYTGADIEFKLAQYSDKVSATVTGDGASYENGVITVRNAGKYTVTVSLADNGESTCWDTSKADDIASYSIEIEVTKKKLSADISCSESTFSWEAGETPTMTITDERVSGDDIEYYVYYLKTGSSAKIDDIDSSKQNIGDSVVVTMPSDIGIGSYTFVVELKSNSTSAANGNYYIDGGSKTRQFSIVGNGITVTADKIKWKVNSVDIGQSASDKLSLTYTGKPYVFTVDESNLRSMGIKIDTGKGTKGIEGDITQTKAGTYSVTVWVCNYDYTYEEYSGSFTLSYEINRAKYNLSGVKWNYREGSLIYNGNTQSVALTGLPSTLIATYDKNTGRNAKEYVATVLSFENTGIDNYVTPLYQDKTTYDGEFEWTLNWEIAKATLDLLWTNTDIGKEFKVKQVTGNNAQYIERYKYYRSNGASIGSEIDIEEIKVTDSAERYWVEAILTASAAANYEIREATKRATFVVGSDNEKITVEMTVESFTYDGKTHGGELKVTQGTFDLSKIKKTYYKGSVSKENELKETPTDAGDYIIVLSLSEQDEEEYELSKTQIAFSIAKAQIKAQWDTSGQVPVISNLTDFTKTAIGYKYYDADGNELPNNATLEVGKNYTVKAIITGSNVNNFEFVDENGVVLPSDAETYGKEFTVKTNGGNQGGSGSTIGGISGGDGGKTSVDFGKVGETLKQWWQVIASVASIVMVVIFTAKGISYANKRKKVKKGIEKYSNYYAGVAGLFGWAMSAWTAIAGTLMGLAVLSMAYMLIEKSRYNKAQEELDETKEEYERNRADEEERKRDENMRMMLMGIMGGNNGSAGQVGYVSQTGIGAEEMRGLISETVTALLPNMQQALPQQASGNDELVQKLMEQNDKLMKKLSEQTKVVEREVAASTSSNDELMKHLLEEQKEMREVVKKIAEQPVDKTPVTIDEQTLKVITQNNSGVDETIKRILENQDKLIAQMLELSKDKSQPQVIEKVVEVPVEIEKIVEKEVKVEVPVEKVVEKQVVKEVKVPVVAAVPTKPKKEVAPRLTLDEAYAQLPKQQQKYFDGLREYALTKDKCKEKKSTYAIVIGQSTVNPLIKLTIKKNMTVALFKMEDEYLKDIKRDATSDGTKVKVKETEVEISDAQACKTAKHMIDLREDQIERYQDLLKEQRSLSKR